MVGQASRASTSTRREEALNLRESAVTPVARRKKAQSQRFEKMTEAPETETKAGVQMNWFSSEPCVNEEIPETPQTNEEPEEQWLKLDEQLPELTAECVESEDLSTLLQQELTEEEAGADTGLDPDQLLQSESESYSEPDNDEEWEPPSSPIAQQEKEADEYHVKPAKTKVIQVEGEKKYENFVFKWDLNRHMKTHIEKPKNHIEKQDYSGDMPYSCPVCGRVIGRFPTPQEIKSETEFWPIDGMDSDSDNDPFEEIGLENNPLEEIESENRSFEEIESENRFFEEIESENRPREENESETETRPIEEIKSEMEIRPIEQIKSEIETILINEFKSETD
ncbi:hypothetical protein WMY93_024736 [Mugilogobius chulae]|uniref:Uncharacterized protein n=1 Tax=Mugilogobius chulae TaxID=88201 RepID=A0AAW0ND05_9GOBI